MIGKRGFTRLALRQSARLAVVLLAAAILSAPCGCARKDSGQSAIRREYAKGRFEETIALCERAVRNNAAGGEVYYYYGLSLLAEGRDNEAFERLEAAVSADSGLVRDVSGELVERAMDSIARGMPYRAARLVREAQSVDVGLRVGALGYLVADSYYEEKNWEVAASCYRRVLTEYPDTSAAEGAYFNLAACQCASGDSIAAVETLEAQLSRFPRGPLAGQANWGLSSLLLSGARSEFDRGNYDAAAAMVIRMPRSMEGTALGEQARFLLGECYERKGDFAEAYEVFRSIGEDGREGTGRIAERARAKMKAFRDAGLR